MLKFTTLFTLVWIALNEELSIFNVLAGLILSVITILFTGSLFFNKGYISTYQIPFYRMIVYHLYVVFLIFKSGMSAIPRIIAGNDKTKTIKYLSGCKDDFALSLLSNAITLTPGTVTLDLTKNELTVLCFTDSKNNALFDIENARKIEKILEGR
ncbi:MAG TPA: Na+/H+ antiporter subunit E [Clostridia bacterium]|nr:Na+/H+ antiporter subunit E [Clostridia bacterium]